MSELTAAIDANDEVLNIDTLPPSPYVQIDDEVMEIRGVKPEQIYPPTQELQPPTIRVRRGVGGTTAASHADGATLEPVYGLGGSGGGEQIILLRGPYRVTYQTAGVVDPDNYLGARISDEPLPEGAILLDAWAQCVTVWTASAGLADTSLFVNLEKAARDDFVDVVGYPLTSQSGGPGTWVGTEVGTRAGSGRVRQFVMQEAGIHVGAVVDLTAGSLTAGSADVFLLLAVPTE